MLSRLLYRNYRFLHAVQSWIRRRFTAGGKLVLTGLILSAVLGLDTNRTMAYQVFTLLLSLLAISLVSSLFFRAPLAVRRILPRFGTVNQPLPYRLQIRNIGPTPLRGLVVQEELADARPSLEAFIRAREPGEDRRNWFDRNLGYFRWCWLVSQNEAIVAREQSLPALPPMVRPNSSANSSRYAGDRCGSAVSRPPERTRSASSTPSSGSPSQGPS